MICQKLKCRNRRKSLHLLDAVGNCYTGDKNNYAGKLLFAGKTPRVAAMPI
jgi:hypothetical protein